MSHNKNQIARQKVNKPRDKAFYFRISRQAIITKKLQAIPAEKCAIYLRGSMFPEDVDRFVDTLTPSEHDLFFELILLGMQKNGVVVLSEKKLGELAAALSPDKVRKVRGKDEKAHQPYRESLVKRLVYKMKAAHLLAIQNRKMVNGHRQTNRYQVAPCFYLPVIKEYILKYLYTLRANTICSLSYLTAYCYKKLGAQFTSLKKGLLNNICILNSLSLCNYIGYLEFLFELNDVDEEEDSIKSDQGALAEHQIQDVSFETCYEKDLSCEEESFLKERMRRIAGSTHSFVLEDKKKLRQKEVNTYSGERFQEDNVMEREFIKRCVSVGISMEKIQELLAKRRAPSFSYS